MKMNSSARLYLLLVALAPLALPVAAQPSISYNVGWDNPEDHYYNVSMEIGALRDATVDVRMPAWRPGRYILQNYVKYVVAFSAHTPDGTSLPFKKVDKDTWRVQTMGNHQIIIDYRNYANVLDAGESYLDSTEAYLNPISVLMNVPGRLREPVALTIQQPDGWQVATPLNYDASANAFIAADYHELVDSPVLVSPDFKLISFNVGDATTEIVIQGDWEYDESQLVEDHKAIVTAQIELFDHTPFKRYVFMYHLLDRPMGHGVEHKNSTSIVLGPASVIKMPEPGEKPEGMYATLLRVASHELFHAWNVERIRPAVMYPTDYSKEAYSSQMWIFEGITDYYADVTLHRAGLTSDEEFLKALGGTLYAFDNSPGRKITSIAMSSFDSWTKEGHAPPNTWYSFYTAGKAIGLALDMEVRGRTNGEKSLDDVFRYLYAEYPMKARGLPEDGFQQALEEVAGSSFATFFDNHIYGVEDVDWDSHLRKAGYHLMEEQSSGPREWLRVFFGEAKVLGVDPSGLAGKAGIKAGDEITRVGPTDVTDGESLAAAFAHFEAGDLAAIHLLREGEEQVVEIELGAKPTNAFLMENSTVSASQAAIRDSWIGN